MIDKSIQANAATRRNSSPPVELIYCAGNNVRFAEIAIRHGYKYGAQLPSTIYYPIYFADQDWKNPNRERYMAELAKHRPHMATVLDLETPEQYREVISWAEEAAQYVDTVLIIPKCFGAIAKLPRTIGGADVRLAYSVPTKYGGTDVPIWEFDGWPVHLLGGSPQRQMELAKYLRVRSVDGNYAQRAAVQWCGFWQPGTATYAANKYWPTLRAAGIGINRDAPYKAFELSCKYIAAAWNGESARHVFAQSCEVKDE